MNKRILIWGAGKIGRGFVAPAFVAGGYRPVFVDAAEELVEEMKSIGRFSVVEARPEEEPDIVTISEFDAFHISETNAINDLVATVPLMAVAVFPGVFGEIANAMIVGLRRRTTPVDIIICANTRSAAEQFESSLRECVDEQTRSYLEDSIGFIDSVIMRIAIPTPNRFSSYGPLTVTTNGFPYMPVARNGFKGPIPELPILKPIEDIDAEETRKYFTYNMAHAVFAYAGQMYGGTTILEAAKIPAVMAEVQGAMSESAAALQAAYGYTEEEMDEWCSSVIKNLTNPLLEDSLQRLGKDPIRKLGPTDRLVGPAVLCKQNGILPYYLTRTIARACMFRNEDDPAVVELRMKLEADGVGETVKQIAELHKDPELVWMVSEHFRRLQDGRAEADSYERVSLLRKAYEGGFAYEKKIHGCAQCALASLFDVGGNPEPVLFKAASAMAGGFGISGDGVCGGYAAGVMWMGRYVGRRFELMDGDKEAQYKSFEMTQALRDRYLETYGTLTCRNIHEKIFGRAYILRTKAVRKEFEAAGAHLDRCTSVVAMASMWTTDILIDEGFLIPEETAETV